MNTENSPPTTARTIAQAILNILCLAGLYAAAWTGRLAWSWFLGAVGLSMAWVTPALLIQGFQMYARALHAPPPSAGFPTDPGVGAGSSRRDAPPRPDPMEGPPTLPPGVFGFVELARRASRRPVVAIALGVLLSTSGCSGGGANVSEALNAVWKVVTMTCTGVRVATPLVDDLLRGPPDAGTEPAQRGADGGAR